MNPRAIDSTTLISSQIAVDDVPTLKQQGVTMIVNNRPEGEDPDQPAAVEIEDAAERAGIAYRHIPIIRGIGPSDIEEMDDALTAAGNGKVLAFCRSGTRSALVWALVQRRSGRSRDEVEQALASVNVDSALIAHLL